MYHRLTPKIYSVLKQEGYSFQTSIKDLLAGIIVGILSIPMSIAFAIAAGARPEQGIYTAIIAGFFVAILGGSRNQIAGPTGAFVALIYNVIHQFGYEGLVLATIAAGVFLILLGIFKAGTIIKFIPYPVIIGFTSGLSVVIAVNQLPDIFALKIANFPSEFYLKCSVIIKNLLNINFYSFAIGILALSITIIWPKYCKKISGSLIAIIVTSLLVYFFHLPVEIIQERFGAIPNHLPAFTPPSFSINLFLSIMPSAIAIALLGGIESLLSAMVADGMTGKKHRSDAELLAQGIANIFCGFFYGIPATGAIARTATGIKNGAKTPISSIFYVITMSMVMLFFGKFVGKIPFATIGGIMLVIAYNMSEWRHFKKIFLSPKEDIFVLLITFLFTIFIDLVTAIECGVILALFLFVNKLSKNVKAEYVKTISDEDNFPSKPELSVPQDIEVFEVYGPLFFAAVETFKTALTRINHYPKVLIIRLRAVSSIDSTGIRALEDVLIKTINDKTILLLSGVSPSLRKDLEKADLIDKIGAQYIFVNFDLALKYAINLLEEKKPEQSKLEFS